MDSPAYEARAELSWLRWKGDQWETWRASNASKPGKGQVDWPSATVPVTWSKAIGGDPDKSKFYFFTSIDCRLTEGEKWTPEFDPAEWKLEEWMESAPRIEREFVAGKMKIE